jgi:hypothetical protein
MKKIIFICILQLMLTMTIKAENKQPSLSKKDIGELFSRGELGFAKIFLKQPGDLQQIESTGVVIQTKELGYVVILGDHQRLEKVRTMGFSMENPIETDHKLRQFRVLIHNLDEFLRLRAIAADVWPDHWSTDTKFPVYVRGRAYDSEFKWAKETGLDIELCHSQNCD